MLAAYEAGSIDSAELSRRLLLAIRADDSRDDRLLALLRATDEASDLGQNERELIAWAAARYWRSNV